MNHKLNPDPRSQHELDLQLTLKFVQQCYIVDIPLARIFTEP